MEELKRRDKDNRVKLHTLELEMQKVRFEKESQKTEFEGIIKDLKRTCTEAKDELEKYKLKSAEDIKAVIEDFKVKEEEMRKIGTDYEDNNRMLER